MKSCGNPFCSRLLRSAAVLLVTTGASAGAAMAQTANVTPANVNVLNLLSPFLSLNGSVVGQTTLIDNIVQAIATNNGASTAQQQMSYSDKNLLGSAVNTVTGLTGSFGVAANLAGGLPNQPAPTGGVPGVQPVGGLGAALGAKYDNGVNAYANGTDTTSLANTVSLLTKAYSFTSSDLGVAKNYFANGNKSNNANKPYGGVVAVAPAGYTLPTYNGLPNTTTNVYDTAYGVSNTDPTQNVYGSSRPVQVTSANTTWGKINSFDPTSIVGIATNPSFPSGHTTYAYTDSILTGMLVPGSYQSMLLRASEYGNSRIVLGVHYPLDIIASRSFVQYDLAQALTNSLYINNASTTGTSVDLPTLFNSANAELSPYLCGSSNCAADPTNPYAPSAANAAKYAARLTYGLPTLTYAAAPQEQAPAGGPDASILLAPIFGGSTSAAMAIAPGGGLDGNLATSTIDQIVENTEGNALAAFYGTSLSYWSRINLYAAIGYFGDVTGKLTMASSDTLKIGATVGATGDLVANGAIAGSVAVEHGGLLEGTGSAGSIVNDGTVRPGDAPGTLTVLGDFLQKPDGTLDIMIGGLTDYSKLVNGGEADLDGLLDIDLVNGFALTSGDTFDFLTAHSIIGAFSQFALDGMGCASQGGEAFRCTVGEWHYNFSLDNTGSDVVLSTSIAPAPEASTWAMLALGFAGLGLAGAAKARKARVTVA